MKLIGLSGYAGCGKDTAAQALVACGWTRMAFADAVRDAALALDPIVAGKARLSELVLDCGWEGAKKLPEVRRLLQRLGTEAGRDIHGYDCWVRIVEDKLASRTVITDVRFGNEAAMVHSNGGKLIWIERPGVGPANDHVSESLEPIKNAADAVIVNDGTVEQLYEQILKLTP